jgi:hypothetical protein
VAKDDVLAWGWRDTIVALLVSASSVLLSMAVVLRRPDLVEGAEFLFHDAGHNLLTAQLLLNGGTLYRDLSFPYGPVSAYAYVVAAWILGNTPASYLTLFTVVSALNVALAYALMRRCTNTGVAACVSVGVLALLPIPGAVAGAFTASSYVVLERTALLLVALAWAPPDRRTIYRALWLGAIFGMWQGVKFGGAFIAGGAVVMLDLICLTAIGYSKERVAQWTRALLLTLVAFVAVECGWVVYALATLPRNIARDVVWPYYMFQAYAVFGQEKRWLVWGGWRLMVGQYLLPLTAAGLGVTGLAWWVKTMWKSGASDVSGSSCLLLLFYGLAAFSYFHHIYHFQQFLWVFVPTAALALGAGSARVRSLVAAAWAPGVLMVIHTAVLTPVPASMQSVPLPTGGQVVVSQAIADRLRFLQRVESAVDGAPVLYAPIGSGWHYAYGVPRASRHTFFFAPDVIRPYERDEFVRSFDHTAAVITCGESTLPTASESNVLLDAALGSRVFGRLQLWETGARCNVYRISPIRHIQ